MATESALTRHTPPSGTKGPGTNKAELETLFWGVDSGRADTVEAHIENGIDLAAVVGTVAANGLGGYAGKPLTFNTLTLNDTTDTELTGTRVTVPAFTDDAVPSVRVEAFLLFAADAAGVDVTDVSIEGLALVGYDTMKYIPAGGTSVTTDTLAQTFTSTAHTVDVDVPATGYAVVELDLFGTPTSVAGTDVFIQAKSVNDAGGTVTFSGGWVKVTTFPTDTFVAIGSAP